MVVRCIQFMPLNADSQWQRDKVLFAHEIIQLLEAEFGPLRPVDKLNDSEAAPRATEQPESPLLPALAHSPSQDFEFVVGRGTHRSDREYLAAILRQLQSISNYS